VRPGATPVRDDTGHRRSGIMQDQGSAAELDTLRFPAGRFDKPTDTGAAARARWTREIAALPGLLRVTLATLDDATLDTPYRPGGWTARQVVHHLPDSHMNAYVRFMLALTEDAPAIRPYNEAAWAALHDARPTDTATSLALLEALHARWVTLIEGMADADFERTFHHPEYGTAMTLGHTLALYAWHGRHHHAHILAARDAAHADQRSAHERRPPPARPMNRGSTLEPPTVP
jgi:hypothetical protein